MNERPIPNAALRDPAAVEMLRVWVAAQQLHCSLKIGMYRDGMGIDEELAWGTILADAAKHIAKGLHPNDEKEQGAALLKIRLRLNEELSVPSSDISGGFV